MARAWLLAALVGCGDPLLGADDTLGAYFVVSGPLDPELALDPDRTRAGIAWAWAVEGQLGGVVQDVPLEPRLFAYALTVESPPDPVDATTTARAPGSLDTSALLVGLPILYEGRPPAVDPGALLDWSSGASDTLSGALDGAATGTTPAYLLLGLGAGDPPAGDWCRLDGAVPGLTLYRDDGLGCGGWRPVAAPGERTEFQGIEMTKIP